MLNSKNDFWNIVPNGVLDLILKNLKLKDLTNMLLTSKKMQHKIDNNLITWKRYCKSKTNRNKQKNKTKRNFSPFQIFIKKNTPENTPVLRRKYL